MLERGGGVLLHVSSLPGYGPVGNIGYDSYKFIEFLNRSKQDYWQILPLNPIDECNSPYSPKSAFAGEISLIDPELISNNEEFKGDGSVYLKADFKRARKINDRCLRMEYENCRNSLAEDLSDFKKDHFWLEDYALFTALKEHFNDEEWTNWPIGIRRRDEGALQRYKDLLHEEIGFITFSQYIFFKQWEQLKEKAVKEGIKIIGDIPIYVPLDSADVWATPELFQLDDSLKPGFVAGAPPDFFSEGGQKWDMPLYNWDIHEKSGYDWWKKRISHSFKLFDVVRLDHFRGFEAYWSIPADDKDARNGHWEDGPGKKLMKVLKDVFSDKGFIAEDLGDITDKVRELREYFGYPGMSILQFAFDGDDKNIHLPSNSPANTVVYTGTHDNAPLPLWLEELKNSEFKTLAGQLKLKSSEDILEKIMEIGFKSHCLIAMLQLQDILPFDKDSRMNLPGTAKGNWVYKAPLDLDYDDITKKLVKLAYYREC